MGEMAIEEIEAAAAEQDPKKAFWMYVNGPAFATSEPDFISRVLPAVADVVMDAEARAEYKDQFGVDAPEGATHFTALA